MVEPTINNCKANRVLIDGGSSLNILFLTLDAIQVPTTRIEPMKHAFDSIIPGSLATPIGQVSHLVTLGMLENLQIERILFVMAEFETAYNAILGRSTLVKFIVSAHYVYQGVKLSCQNESL